MYENARSQTFGIVFIKKSRFQNCQKLSFQNTVSSSFFKNTSENANTSLLSKLCKKKCEILKISSQNSIMTKILKKNLLPWHHRFPLCFCPVASVYLLSASGQLFTFCSLVSLLACCFVAFARTSCSHRFA